MTPVLQKGEVMASLSVRRIDDELYEQLKKRAARHGASMEEEVRQILRAAVSAPDRLGDLAIQHFGADGVELDLPSRDPHEPIVFGE